MIIARMSTPMRLVLPALTAITLTLAAAVSLARGQEAAAGDLAITDAWAGATPPRAEIGAVYLRIENRAAAADRLLSAASPAAQSVTLHQSLEEDGIALMRPMSDAAIPAAGVLEMEPGGTHLMLMGLAAPLKEGSRIPLTLTFERSAAMEISVPVLAIGARHGGAKHGTHKR